MVESLLVKRGLSQGSGHQACASQFATDECVMLSLSFPHCKMGAGVEVLHCESSILLRLCDFGTPPQGHIFPLVSWIQAGCTAPAHSCPSPCRNRLVPFHPMPGPSVSICHCFLLLGVKLGRAGILWCLAKRQGSSRTG